MRGITIDLAASRRELRSLTTSTVALVVSIPDLDVTMAGSDWTVGEAAAHLVFGARDYSEHARGAERCYRIDPADTARSHHRDLEAMVERHGHKLGIELQSGIGRFLDITEGRAADDLLPWHERSNSCAAMTSLLLGEQLLHGYDIARALGAR